MTLFHTDQTKIQEVLDFIPDAIDITVWEEEYEVSAITLNEDQTIPRPYWPSNVYQAKVEVRFHNDADRESIYQAVNNIQGMLIGFEIGTIIRKLDCMHDGTGGDCVSEIVYEVVA